MSPQITAMLKSYLHGVLVAVTPLIAMHNTNAWAYLAAVVAGVIAPALRAIDKKDPCFGMVADIAETETAALAKPKTTK